VFLLFLKWGIEQAWVWHGGAGSKDLRPDEKAELSPLVRPFARSSANCWRRQTTAKAMAMADHCGRTSKFFSVNFFFRRIPLDSVGLPLFSGIAQQLVAHINVFAQTRDFAESFRLHFVDDDMSMSRDVFSWEI
jgi:hypothetical protein